MNSIARMVDDYNAALDASYQRKMDMEAEHELQVEKAIDEIIGDSELLDMAFERDDDKRDDLMILLGRLSGEISRTTFREDKSGIQVVASQIDSLVTEVAKGYATVIDQWINAKEEY